MTVDGRVLVPVLLAAVLAATAASCSSSGGGTTPTTSTGASSRASATTTTAPSGSGAAGSTSSTATTGVLSGRLIRVGGPSPGAAVPLTGKVTATGPGGRHTVDVGADGAWSLTLAPGRYTLDGRSPQMDDGRMPCTAMRTVVVVAGATVTQDAICTVP